MATLTLSQRQAVKTDATVTHAATALPAPFTGTLLTAWTIGNESGICAYYNSASATSIWRSDLQFFTLLEQIIASEEATWTTNQLLQLLVLANLPVVNATSSLVRNLFNNIAGGTTVTNWSVAARRSATQLEALFTTASGGFFNSNVFGQILVPEDMLAIRNS